VNTLKRYGIEWTGPKTPIAVPMKDGHWTPWHLAQERIAELEKTEPLLQKVLDCCDGLHCEITQANYGAAKNWLRHISDAYADYQDSIDLSKGGAE
jgi:hypothetical protein